MRVALISDIHGNLTALDAVLADLESETLDHVVCLGDVVAFGPQPRETIERLRELDYPTVMGNTDEALLNPMPIEFSNDHQRRILDLFRWCAGLLSATDLDYLRQFRPILEFSLGHGNKLLCFHGSPRSFNDVIVAATAEEDLDGMLADHSATVMAGGHTHKQLLRQHGETIVINPGSVGIDSSFRAEYALIESTNGGLNIELRRVLLDDEEIMKIAVESGMPHAEWWAGP